MTDAELEEIRKNRLAQLQQQQGGGGGGGTGGDQGGGGGGGGGQSQEEQKKQQEAEARQHILSQILHPAAADRLNRIRLVKESRAAEVEDRLITLARTGQLRAKVTEDQLKDLLNAVAEKKKEEGGGERIVVSRRKGGWDEEGEDELLGL